MAPLNVALPRRVRCCGVPLIVTALLALGTPSAHAQDKPMDAAADAAPPPPRYKVRIDPPMASGTQVRVVLFEPEGPGFRVALDVTGGLGAVAWHRQTDTLIVPGQVQPWVRDEHGVMHTLNVVPVGKTTSPRLNAGR